MPVPDHSEKFRFLALLGRNFIAQLGCWVLVFAYVAIVEGLFYQSKSSFLDGLTQLEMIGLGSNLLAMGLMALTAVSALSALLLSLSAGIPSGKIKRPATTLLESLPFLVAGILTYYYFDRWTYTAFDHGMASRWFPINIAIFLAFLFAGLLYYRFNGASIQGFFMAHWEPFLAQVVLVGVLSTWNLVLSIPEPFEKNVKLEFKSPSDQGNRPNIVIVTFDGFNFTNSPLMGYGRNTTPNLLRRKNQFAIFTRAMAISTDSRSGNSSIFSGISPITTRLYRYPSVLSREHKYRHVPGMLRKLGYYNVNMGQELYSNPELYLMKNGFSEVNGLLVPAEAETSETVFQFQDQFPLENQLLINIFWDDYLEKTKFTFKLSEALKRRKEEALVTFKPTYFSAFLERLKALAEGDQQPFMIHYHSTVTHHPVFQTRHKVYSNLPNIDSPECRKMREKGLDCQGKRITKQQLTDLFDDAMLDLDEDTEKIIRILEETGQYDNTILIITTDHEFEWNTDGVPVALMIHTPGQFKGRIIPERVWLLDIAPTLLDMTGLQQPEWLDGVSLLPLISSGDNGPQRKLQRKVPIHIAYGSRHQLRRLMVFRGNYKHYKRLDSFRVDDIYDVSNGPGGTLLENESAGGEDVLQLRKMTERLIEQSGVNLVKRLLF